MPTSKKCLNCNKLIYVKPSKALTAKYCSRACKYKSCITLKFCKKCQLPLTLLATKNHRVYCSTLCKGKSLKICTICDAKFKPKNAKQKLCSKKCSGVFFSKNYNYQIKKVCVTCSVEFSVLNHRTETAKYCSNKCRTQTMSVKSQIAKIELKCEACSKMFCVVKSQADTKYCSADCRNDHARIRGNRKCTKCETTKPLSDFLKTKKTKIGFLPVCKKCLFQMRRESALMKNYGITEKEFARMAQSQNHLCLICHTLPQRLFVDHCHTSGKIRGLLCLQCNTGIGMFKDSSEYLNRAISYLQQNSFLTSYNENAN